MGIFSLILEFPVSGEDFSGDVVVMKKSFAEPICITPGEPLEIRVKGNPSGKDKPPVDVKLSINFQEPFSSDAVVVSSMRAHVRYGTIEPGEERVLCQITSENN